MSVRVQHEDFDPGVECAALTHADKRIGALATFVGIVRGDDNLSSLTLEHYAGMTEREIARHVAEAQSRWPLLGVRIVHRTGRLVPGDRIVFVGVGSSHRKAAFEACEFLMDYLKTRAPFWKQEERAGATSWVEARTTDDDAAMRWTRG
ncbi:MAG: molybdenum cofactor biosynthesis protein MoaE [Rhizomicrobium sp.]|jgi:molybdopterin synthase catalytic subunit